jgi:hypothetical protein
MSEELWKENYMSEITYKRKTFLAAKYFNDIFWLGSGNCEKNIVEMFAEQNEIWYKHCDLHINQENFGKKMKFYIQNNKLYVAILSDIYINFFEYDDEKWIETDEKYTSKNYIVDFDVCVHDEKKILLIKLINDAIFIDEKLNILKNFNVQLIYPLIAQINEKIYFFYITNCKLNICSMLNFADLNLIKTYNASLYSVDITQYCIYICTCYNNKINLITYNIYDDIWKDNIKYIKTDNNVNQIIVKCDTNGKLWIFVNDLSEIKIYEIHNNEITLSKKIDVAHTKYICAENNHDNIIIVSEKILSANNNPQTTLGKGIQIVGEMLNNNFENENYADEISDFFSYSIELTNYEDIEENKIAKYLIWSLETFKKLIDDNVNNLDSFTKRNLVKTKWRNILDDIMENNSFIEKRFLIFRTCHTTIKYKQNLDYLCDLFLLNNTLSHITINNNQIKQQTFLQNIKHNTIIQNHSKKILKIFANNKNIILDNTCALNLETLEITKYNSQITNLQNINHLNVKYKQNQIQYNCNYIIFGYVYLDDLNMFPLGEYEINKNKKYVLTFRYENTNNFPYINDTLCFDMINNLKIFVMCNPSVYEHNFVFNKLLNYCSDLKKEFFHVEYFSGNTDEISWKNPEKEIVFNIFSLNNIFYNKTDVDITINIFFYESLDEKEFILKENSLLMIKTEKKNIMINNIYCDNYHTENDIIDIFENAIV